MRFKLRNRLTEVESDVCFWSLLAEGRRKKGWKVQVSLGTRVNLLTRSSQDDFALTARSSSWLLRYLRVKVIPLSLLAAFARCRGRQGCFKQVSRHIMKGEQTGWASLTPNRQHPASVETQHGPVLVSACVGGGATCCNFSFSKVQKCWSIFYFSSSSSSFCNYKLYAYWRLRENWFKQIIDKWTNTMKEKEWQWWTCQYDKNMNITACKLSIRLWQRKDLI